VILTTKMIESCVYAIPLSNFRVVLALANQKTARTGNVLGIAGVTLGLAATTTDMAVVGK
jgi:NAD/NADP transhydrogenase beta subunit